MFYYFIYIPVQRGPCFDTVKHPSIARKHISKTLVWRCWGVLWFFNIRQLSKYEYTIAVSNYVNMYCNCYTFIKNFNIFILAMLAIVQVLCYAEGIYLQLWYIHMSVTTLKSKVTGSWKQFCLVKRKPFGSAKLKLLNKVCVNSRPKTYLSFNRCADVIWLNLSVLRFIHNNCDIWDYPYRCLLLMTVTDCYFVSCGVVNLLLTWVKKLRSKRKNGSKCQIFSFWFYLL